MPGRRSALHGARSTQREAVAKYLYERVMADRGEPKAGWENCPGQFVEDWLAQADVLIAIVKESDDPHA